MSEIHDVVIIGGGTTGLSACIYTPRYGLSTLLVEGTVFGGQIINADTIENFPGFPQGVKGPDLVASLQEQASDLGVEYGFGEVQSLDVQAQPMVVRTDSDEFPARSVIIATGGERNRLGIPGEEEFEGRGVSTCATCDGFFFADREVVVVGVATPRSTRRCTWPRYAAGSRWCTGAIDSRAARSSRTAPFAIRS